MKLLHVAGVFGLAFLAFSVARFPLAVALQLAGARDAGLTYSHASGTIWDGQITDAALGAVALGTVDVAVSPGALMSGRADVTWRVSGPGLSGRGNVVATRGGTLSLSDTIFDARLDGMPTLVPMTGMVSLSARSLAFGPEGCEAADARIETDPQLYYRQGRSWRSPPLSGDAACEDGALVLPLSGRRGAEAVEATLRLAPDLTYRVEAQVRTSDEGLRQAAKLFNLADENGAIRLAQTGALAR